MKFQRIKTGVLAGAMALALASPAFAAADPLAPALKIGSTTKLPTINLQMPTSPAIVVNPYQLKVTVGSLKDKVDPIVSPVMSVTNLSDCPMQIAVKVGAAVGGAVTLESGTMAADTAATPKVYLTFAGEVGDKAGDDVSVAGVAVTTTETAISGFAEDSAASATNTLAAGTGTKAASEKGVYNFVFAGDTNKKATWTAKDTVTPSMTFKFTPLVDMPS